MSVDPRISSALNVITSVAASLVRTGDDGAITVGTRLNAAASQIRQVSCDHTDRRRREVKMSGVEHLCMGCGLDMPEELGTPGVPLEPMVYAPEHYVDEFAHCDRPCRLAEEHTYGFGCTAAEAAVEGG